MIDQDAIDRINWKLHRSIFSNRVAAELSQVLDREEPNEETLLLLFQLVPQLLSNESIGHEQDKQLIYAYFKRYFPDHSLNESFVFL